MYSNNNQQYWVPTVWQTLGWRYIYVCVCVCVCVCVYNQHVEFYIHPALCIYYYYPHFYRSPEPVTTRKPGFKARSPRTPQSWTLGDITQEWVYQFACACMCAQTFQSHSTLCHLLNCIARKAPLSMEFSRKEYWTGLLCPSLGDLPEIQGSNTCLRHCRQILYLWAIREAHQFAYWYQFACYSESQQK